MRLHLAPQEEHNRYMDGLVTRGRGKYRVSPLAQYERALETATALLALQVSPAMINFELRREHDFTEAQATAVIREALSAPASELELATAVRSTF
jgi:hypothetical protein